MFSLFISVTILVLIVYSGLIFFYKVSWDTTLSFVLPYNTTKAYKTFITIVIPARNEEKNIKNCLDSILNQSYPPDLFEIIVVDDHSDDDTAAIVTSLANKNIRLVSLESYTSGNALNSYKKKAIEIAIEESRGVLIVTTDADCIAPKKWLETIAAFYELKKPAFIAAPV